ncbi:hypothetical protein V1264_021404 [Littorina saxatilis]|uniref:Chitin-binding type-4 domain-containing protein n=1 Tax=Littorina saxatilis TaxID=31220 RepID=A0AAN9FXM9_9CAEN
MQGTDMVTFSLCPIRQPGRDITWGCGGQGGSLKVFGWANRYMPVRSGVHRVTLQLPQGFTCSRCVLQWRWRTSYRRSRRECSSTPWLWACYNNVQYINCADIAITSPYNNPWPYVLLAGS